jgi:hypothetical protein
MASSVFDLDRIPPPSYGPGNTNIMPPDEAEEMSEGMNHDPAQLFQEAIERLVMVARMVPEAADLIIEFVNKVSQASAADRGNSMIASQRGPRGMGSGMITPSGTPPMQRSMMPMGETRY